MLRALIPAVLFGLLLGGLLLASPSVAAVSPGANPEATVETMSDNSSGPGWGRILGACAGVCFGGLLAVRQLRGMRNRS